MMPTGSQNESKRAGLWSIKAVPNINILKRLASLIADEVKNIEDEDNLILGENFNLEDYIQKIEINVIRYALEITHNNQVAAARLLGIKPTTLNNKIKRYEIYCSAAGKIHTTLELVSPEVKALKQKT
jgi:DNA-binding NtrC family response regulator